MTKAIEWLQAHGHKILIWAGFIVWLAQTVAGAPDLAELQATLEACLSVGA
ncbi:MAG: hypothetical protein OXI30_07620 [Chloroflexota bacterium]|nr:hypothetical protein [Chloroflexota bacterium]